MAPGSEARQSAHRSLVATEAVDRYTSVSTSAVTEPLSRVLEASLICAVAPASHVALHSALLNEKLARRRRRRKKTKGKKEARSIVVFVIRPRQLALAKNTINESVAHTCGV